MLTSVLLAALATVKITVQGYFSRGRIKTGKDSLMLNGSIFASVAIVMAILFLRKLPSVQVFWYAVPMAVAALCFQLSYMLAMKAGPISLSVAIAGFNFLIPMIFGIVLYDESINLEGVMAIVLLGMAIVLLNHKGKVGQCEKHWLLLAILACTFSGLSNSVTMMFSRSLYAEQKDQLVIFGNAIASVLSFTAASFMKKGEEHGFYMDKKLLLGLAAIGGALGIYSLLMVEGLAKTSNSGLFLSVLNVLSLVFCTLFDGIVFKQKLNRDQWAGILVSMAAIVIANI